MLKVDYFVYLAVLEHVVFSSNNCTHPLIVSCSTLYNSLYVKIFIFSI